MHFDPAQIMMAVAIVLGVGYLILVRTQYRPPVSEPDAVVALQRALLPAGLPVVDGLRMSASYVAGTAVGSAGGDFFDAYLLDDDSVAIAVGDAAGSGVAASVTMNTIRQALRSAFIDGARPVDALRRANRVLLRSDLPGSATAVAGIIDPATLQFRYACAGHAPPLLAHTDGTCEVLPGTGTGIPLGLMPFHVSSEQIVQIPVDGLLALYTDGCVSAAADEAAGTDALREALAAARALAPNKPALTIDRAIFGPGERPDDATILVLTPEETLAHLDVRLPAEGPSAALARTALRRFLAASGLGPRREYDALIAAGEAVSNAIEHAYAGRTQQKFTLRGRNEDGACVLFVDDSGSWPGPDGQPFHGRGISMMQDLCDECEITRTTEGTSVMLLFRVAAGIADVSLSVF